MNKKLSFLVDNLKFRKILSEINKSVSQSHVCFFFPCYQLGGAEKAHADILEVFKDYKTTCFITKVSDSDIFKNDFEKYSTLIELSDFPNLLHDWDKKILAEIFNRKKNLVVFGCNSDFFYQIIPYLQCHIKVVDLLHAFSFPYGGYEIISLPVVERINKRIVLGKKTLQNYAELYSNQGKNENLLSRIQIIPNRIDAPINLAEKQIQNPLRIIYVGRNSYEKRTELLLYIAQRCEELQLPVKFNLIGDFPADFSSLNNINIIGVVKDRNTLNNYYQNSDVILITSYREGLPMVILEAMCYGVIPISTNVGEIPDFINQTNNNGFIIEDKTIKHYYDLTNIELVDWMELVDSFVLKIAYLIANPSTAKIMSRNAYLSVKEKFSYEKHKQAYLNALLGTD